jgi:antitoxin ParD1/3/4
MVHIIRIGRTEYMPARKIHLTDRYDDFVEEQVKSGRFDSASDVIRAGLDLLQQQTHGEQHLLDLLRALAAEGFDQLDQGKGIMLDGRQELATYIGRLGKRPPA